MHDDSIQLKLLIILSLLLFELLLLLELTLTSSSDDGFKVIVDFTNRRGVERGRIRALEVKRIDETRPIAEFLRIEFTVVRRGVAVREEV